MAGTERGEQASSGGCVECGAPTDGLRSCGSYDGRTRGAPICNRCACSGCRKSTTCSGCERLRELLRLALGALRSVQSVNVSGVLEEIQAGVDQGRSE